MSPPRVSAGDQIVRLLRSLSRILAQAARRPHPGGGGENPRLLGKAALGPGAQETPHQAGSDADGLGGTWTMPVPGRLGDPWPPPHLA